ncbi:GspH/FimT family pseudopilin [Brevundimonas sp. BH3]|uniref:GspH/FimT family pseudopilin n=1 Tax=Brevundimonas sp. BH3 TaxID=3133089 RepID=UPI003249B5DA
MPTSATGASSRSKPLRQGFTLVELLVVITVIGVAATAVVVSAPDPRPTIAVEGERLAARLIMARDEAILGNRSVAAMIDARGYSFHSFDGVEWHPVTGSLKAALWPEGVSAFQASRVVFDPTGASEPAEIILIKDNRSVTLKVDGAGEVSFAP